MATPLTLVPTDYNWCADSKCAPVPNQYLPHYCGSCFAQAALGAMGDRIAKLTNQVLPLSVQDVIECGREMGHNKGCEGGSAHEVYEYVQQYGVPDASCNPYQAFSTLGVCDMHMRCNTCWPRPPHPSGKAPCDPIDSFHLYHINGYGAACGQEAMMREISTNGPISCGIATPDAFWAYTGGVYVEGGHSEVDHDVEVVGWGVEHESDVEVPYWLVKNSFGTFWGEDGYIRVAQSPNTTLVSKCCHFPIVDSSAYRSRAGEKASHSPDDVTKATTAAKAKVGGAAAAGKLTQLETNMNSAAVLTSHARQLADTQTASSSSVSVLLAVGGFFLISLLVAQRVFSGGSRMRGYDTI